MNCCFGIYRPPVLIAGDPGIKFRGHPQESWTVPARIAPPAPCATVTVGARGFHGHNPSLCARVESEGAAGFDTNSRWTGWAAGLRSDAARKASGGARRWSSSESLFVEGRGRLGLGQEARAVDSTYATSAHSRFLAGHTGRQAAEGGTMGAGSCLRLDLAAQSAATTDGGAGAGSQAGRSRLPTPWREERRNPRPGSAKARAGLALPKRKES